MRSAHALTDAMPTQPRLGGVGSGAWPSSSGLAHAAPRGRTQTSVSKRPAGLGAARHELLDPRDVV
jgi:hypothetical protein